MAFKLKHTTQKCILTVTFRYADTLRIGDYITLKDVQFDNFLCTEGILKENVGISDDLGRFDDFLFCVHLQRQYSAAKELDEFLKSREGNKNDEKNNQKVLKALQVGS